MTIPEFDVFLGLTAFEASPSPWAEQDWLPMLGYQMASDAPSVVGGGIWGRSIGTGFIA
jgi:hypothetical protein